LLRISLIMLPSSLSRIAFAPIQNDARSLSEG
jgi:hypothetical protein